MSTPACPNCGIPMEPIASQAILRNPGMPDYACDERGCWARAWVNQDGTVTKTATAEATWDELKRRVKAAEAAGQAAQGTGALPSPGSTNEEGAAQRGNAA